jgi:hypothetical protein
MILFKKRAENGKMGENGRIEDYLGEFVRNI